MLFEEGSTYGYFKLDGVNYPVRNYHFRYEKDITDRAGTEINFTLENIYDKRLLVNSRNILEVDGVTTIEDLLLILGELRVLVSQDVMVSDQSSDIVDYFLCRDIRELTLSSPLVLNAYTIPVTDATLVTVGNYICVQENARAMQSKILSKAGNVLTVDTPIDYPFTTSASIFERSPDMNVNGAVTPVIFRLNPAPGVTWDVTRIIGSIITPFSDGAPNDSKFGGLPALTKGIVVRKTDGVNHTIFNAKTNGDLKLRMFDVIYSTSVPNSSYGVSFRRTFAGQEKNGVVIRLNGDIGDTLEVLIQDDLSLYNTFRVVAQGHVVLY